MTLIDAIITQASGVTLISGCYIVDRLWEVSLRQSFFPLSSSFNILCLWKQSMFNEWLLIINFSLIRRERKVFSISRRVGKRVGKREADRHQTWPMIGIRPS